MTMKKLFFFTGALAMLVCAAFSFSCSKIDGELPTLSTDAPAEISFNIDGTGGMPFIEITTNQTSWAYSLSPADGGGWLSANTVGDLLVLTARSNELAQQRTPVVIRISAGDAVPVEFTVKQDGFVPGKNTPFRLEGLSGNVVVKFTNGDTANATLSAAGCAIVDVSSPLRTIYSITATASGEVLIGRAEGEEINLKFDAGALAFRDAVNGNTPIGSYAEFALIGTASGALTGSYIQESDLDLLGAEALAGITGLTRQNWTPIGTETAAFEGGYDGGGFTLANIYIDRPSTYDIGLFGAIGGGSLLRNVSVLSGVVSGDRRTGGICGQNNGGTIEACRNRADVSGTYYVGGVCADNNTSATITGCYNTGSVSGIYYVGGVSGKNYYATLDACYNTGTVSGDAVTGGVCGTNNNGAYLIACYSTGPVLATGDNVGGVCGYNGASIKTSYWLKRGTEVGANYFLDESRAFGESSWPDTTMRGWGTGDGSADNTYWKPLTPDPLGKWVAGGTPDGINSVFPKLYWEE